ncbi:DEAD/DEAH box helicase [Sulfurimonas sp. SAG-AH-194-I05]|nr:DEAD/DEAH box helicase [Sulfurimonas sp. SAG-AH-194-I05]MDF1875684.1 DEAD/DEAH box helicase [Sulfurimonas sp. SAG-AH-194-I05]
MPFTKLKLSNSLLKAIKKAGFTDPTPIQQAVIPHVLRGDDVMARAQTGTGKSASFVLPSLELLSQRKTEGKEKIRILVLTPTRELTLQISQAYKTFGEYLARPLKVVSIIGGEGIGQQLFDIQQGCDVLVATSGRFLDVLSKKQMNLSHVELFILDEADKMLDLGFAEELEVILQAIPHTRQNLMFSATYPPKMLQIAKRMSENPISISIESEETPLAKITQRVIEVNQENRAPLLRHLIKEEKLKQTLVFMANKRATDNIAMKFKKHGFNAQSFHGDLDQEERNFTLQAFKNKEINILFTTDLISRGLHIEDIDCVINFDLPRSPSEYIHRIGRTGRAGKSGIAISFIDYESAQHFKLIEKRANISLKRESIESFKLTGEAPKKVKGPAPLKGKKKSKKDKRRELEKKNS